jgi:predicted TIM-barrel fold metal-dependent hydrolase
MATIVDAHLHVFIPPSDRYPRDVEELYPAEMEAPVEWLLEVMDGAGVDRAVLVPLSSHDEYLRACLERFPGRFAGIGVHDPASADPVAALRRRVEETGIQGLRVHHLGDPAAPAVEALETFPLLAGLADEGLKLWFYAAPDQLGLLPAVLDALPDLQVVLNHLGFCPQGYRIDQYGRPHIDVELPPPTLSAVLGLARFANVHVMLSGQYAFSREPWPYRDLEPVVAAVYRAYGAERLLWASDFPWIVREPGYDRQLALVDELLPGITPAERAAILGESALRLLRF